MATFYIRISTASGSKGNGPTCNVTTPPNINSPISGSNAANVSGPGTSPSNRITIAEGDTLSIEIVSSGGHKVQPRSAITDSNNEQSNMGRPAIDDFLTLNSWTVPGLLNVGSTYTATVRDLTTGGNTCAMVFAAFLGALDALYFRINGDGLPTAASDRTTSTTATDTYYYTTFTVAGLTSGRKAFYFAAGGADLKVGSGAYTTNVYNNRHLGVLAGNGETITVRAKSPAALDFKKLVQIYGMQGDGQHSITKWTIGPTSNTDASYGAEFFNASGNKLLSINDRSARFVSSGNITFTGHVDNTTKSVTQTISGMTTGDDWQVFVYVKPGQGSNAIGVVIRDTTKNSGSFTATTFCNNFDNTNQTYELSYVVLKQG